MKKISNWRINIILVLFFLFGAAIISRLFFLQIMERKLFQAQALGQQAGFLSITGSRGQIFCLSSGDSKGSKSSGEMKSLAINKDDWAISANPLLITDKEFFAESVSNALEISKDELVSKINSQDTYIIIAQNILSEKLDRIKALELGGLSWQNNPDRFYPQSEFLSQTIGFLGGEGFGQYGVEGYYDEILQGKVGFKKENEVSLDGSDLYLTIDYNIQYQAESLLKKAKNNFGIDSGQIIVMKPDSGRILALADFPSFDLNRYSKQGNLEIFQNGAIQKLFEPGSIMKPFTIASALNEGKITPNTAYIDTGVLKFGTKSIHNFNNEVYDTQTMTEVLESSINTGAVFAQQQVGNKKFFEYIKKFGFTEKTDIDLQGEVYSRNGALENGPDMNYATASFGQGIELTPMQIARGFCALANGGKLVKPFIIDKIISGTDQVYTEPKVSGPIISQETASHLTSMLVSVVDNGFNKVAKIPGYYIAGKTGTAQVPLKNSKGYEPDKTIQSFVGYGPAFNPQFLIMVKLDNPKVAKSSLSAVPIFKELAQYIINYWKIPPDYDAAKQ